jgi:hypothetical protein
MTDAFNIKSMVVLPAIGLVIYRETVEKVTVVIAEKF